MSIAEPGRRAQAWRAGHGCYATTMRLPLLACLMLAFPVHAGPGTAYIPKAIDLPGTTAAETLANQVWSYRAALNVAALQCQYSPYLHTVPHYNALIKQHAREFARAQTSLQTYFKRAGGKTAGTAFDRYNTRLYQSYATLDAQTAFCRAASDAGFDALAQPIGKLAAIATSEVTVVRVSMTPVGEHLTAMEYGTLVADLPPIPACEVDRKGRERC